MAEEFEEGPSVSPTLIVLIIVGFFCTVFFGGLIALWIYKEQNADKLPLKKKKKLTAKQIAKQRAQHTVVGGE